MPSRWANWRPAIVAVLNDQKSVSGTGFFLGAEGYVITCYHVINGRKEIWLRLNDGSEQLAVLNEEKTVQDCDLAVLRTEPFTHFFYPFTDFDEDAAPVTSAGYQYFGPTIQDVFPSGDGKILGTTHLKLLNKYVLDPVYVIDNRHIQNGISGAPLIIADRMHYAAGLINANLGAGGGFALPFRTASDMSPAFKSFIDAQTELAINEEFGTLREHCWRQVDFELERLIQARKYLPQYYCTRESIEQTFNNFMSSDKQVLPIIGQAGNGKTSVIAALTSHKATTDHIILFLPVYLLRTDNGLETEIREKIESLIGFFPEEILTRHSKKVLIFLDGLNELDGSNINRAVRWITETMDAVRLRAFKVVLTARNDFWEHYRRYIPTDLLYMVEWQVPELLDFNFNEIREALHRYALPERLADNHLLWHPLFLRLYTESVAECDGSFQGVIPIIEHYLTQVCENVDHALGLPSRFSRNRLNLLADKLLESDDYGLSDEQFFAFCGTEPRIGTQFQKENLFIYGTKYRLNFDEVAEFLVSEKLATKLQADPTLLNSYYRTSSLRRGAFPLVFARLEQDQPCIRTLLEGMAIMIEEIDAPRILLYDFMHIVRALANSGDFGEEVILFIANYQRRTNDNLLGHYINQIVERSMYKTEHKLELFRIGLFGAHANLNMNLGHWQTLPIDDFRKFLRNGEHIMDLCLHSDTAVRLLTFVQIGNWLSDRTHVDSLTVHDMACAVLYQARIADLNLVSDLLATHALKSLHEHDDSAIRTLREIAENEKENFIPVLERWFKKGDWDQVLLMILAVCDPDWFTEEQFGKMAKALGERMPLHDYTKELVSVIMAKLPSYREEALQNIMADAQCGKDSGIYRLGNYLSEYFDIFYTPLLNLLKAGTFPYMQREIAKALFRGFFTPEQGRKVAADIRSYFQNPIRNNSLLYSYSEGLESQLYRENQLPQTTEDLRASLLIALKIGNKEVSPVYYYLFNNLEKKMDLIEFAFKYADVGQVMYMIERLFEKITEEHKKLFYSILVDLLSRPSGNDLIRTVMLRYYLCRNVPMSTTLPILLDEPALTDIGDIKYVNDCLKDNLSIEEAFDQMFLANNLGYE